MARSSSSSAKILSTFLFDRFSSVSVLIRRGYASGGGAVNNIVTGSGERKTTGKNISWVPHPITGYYVPENQLNLDRDAAGQILFKNIHAVDDVAGRTNS